jgi:hypothetical protein
MSKPKRFTYSPTNLDRAKNMIRDLITEEIAEFRDESAQHEAERWLAHKLERAEMDGRLSAIKEARQQKNQMNNQKVIGEAQ